MGTLPEIGPRNPNAPHIPLHPRASFDSMVSGFSGSGSAVNSVYMPRRVESIMGDEDRRKYMVAQSNQREAGGAYMEEPRQYYNDIYDNKHGVESSDSVNSTGSYYANNPSNREHYNSHNYSVNRAESSTSASPDDSPEASSGDPSSEQEIAKLQLPEPAHAGRGRSGNACRSPLARHSLVRTATGENSDSSNFQSPGPLSSEDNDEGHSDHENKPEKKRRHKLTKNRH